MEGASNLVKSIPAEKIACGSARGIYAFSFGKERTWIGRRFLRQVKGIVISKA
jgi:hypothetical protein